MKIYTILITFALLGGCATQPYSLSPTSLGAEYGCVYVEPHEKSSGELVDGAYHCSNSMPSSFSSANLCSWNDGYYRKDGSYVPSHMRCKTDSFRSQTTSNSSSTVRDSNAPCVSSYCGPVNVKGYYRKDGTYVRPHTRSRPRR